MPTTLANEAGIGGGHSGVIAEMSLSSSSTFGKKKLLSFVTEPASGKKNAGGKTAVAANAAIAEVLGDKAAVKLSPDVEAAARSIGRAASDKIVAYAKEQGWLNKPEEGLADEAKPGVKPDTKPKVETDHSKTVKLPAAKPALKPAA